MPDKSKRRRNNKNKRKNKGQTQQNKSDTVSDVSKQNSTLNIDNKHQIDMETQVSCENLQESSTVTENVIRAELSPTENQCSTNSQGDKKFSGELNLTYDDNTEKHIDDINIEYKVESPEKTIKKKKLQNNIKSKSMDADDQPKIIEISEDGNNKSFEINNDINLLDNKNILITEVEPEVEWEETDKLQEIKYVNEQQSVPGALSIITIPLNVAECEEVKSLSPEKEKSLRQYLKTLNLSTSPVDSNTLAIKTEIENMIDQEVRLRLRKKGLAEDACILRAGPSRSLHVIDEEVSGESSGTSRRHSYLNDKKIEEECDELEDDVFLTSNDSNMKVNMRKETKTRPNLILQECIRVDAQIKDPDVSEARAAWTTKTVEKMTGAEIVYLTDSSSSTSSVYETNDYEDDNNESDVSVRIITPTIEVTDANNLLKNNFQLTAPDSMNNKDPQIVTHLDKTNSNIEDESKRNNIEYSEQSKKNHEIVVLSTDDIKTNLFVKDISTENEKDVTNSDISNIQEDIKSNQDAMSEKKIVDKYDLEIKVLKCELNDAINNLIKEVVSDSESTQDLPADSFVRQDSSSSIGSSQCTAKYNPQSSSLNDVSGMEFDDSDNKQNENNISEPLKSHVKDVIQSIDDIKLNKIYNYGGTAPTLRNICIKTILKLPYGEQIIEELANVSERLQKMSINSEYITEMPTINNNSAKEKIHRTTQPSQMKTLVNESNVLPPPVKPRNSSLKISHDETKNVYMGRTESKQYHCLSPSQKMLMEKTNAMLPEPHVQKNRNETKFLPESVPKKSDNIDIPFKSQTGSRLLALLQNPNVKNSKENLYLGAKLGYSKNVSEYIERGVYCNENSTKYINNKTKRQEDTFKPIPPPKPRKYSSCYESDESSDFISNSMQSSKNQKKFFHYSTGNLNQEIEDDILNIQNMHRHYNDIYKEAREQLHPRRPSLPKDLCDQQMEYIRRKEREVEAEIYRLETEQTKSYRRGPRAPMLDDRELDKKVFDSFQTIQSSKSFGLLPSQHTTDSGKMSKAFSRSQEEILRNKMYSEYISQMAEREERKQQKVIKITRTPHTSNSKTYSKSSTELNYFDSKIHNPIEKEFIEKAKERWSKLGIRDSETEDENDKRCYREPRVIEHEIKVIDSGEEKDVKKLPNHLQDFVRFTAKESDKTDSPGESELKTQSHGVILCAVIILILTISKYVIRLFRRQ